MPDSPGKAPGKPREKAREKALERPGKAPGKASVPSYGFGVVVAQRRAGRGAAAVFRFGKRVAICDARGAAMPAGYERARNSGHAATRKKSRCCKGVLSK